MIHSRAEVLALQNRELARYQGRPPADEVEMMQAAPRVTTPAAALSESDPQAGGVLIPATYGRKVMELRR